MSLPLFFAISGVSLLTLQLLDVLTFIADYVSMTSMWSSTPIQIDITATSIVALASFFLVSLVLIVFSATIPRSRHRHNQNFTCPITVTSPEDISAMSHVLKRKSSSNTISDVTDVDSHHPHSISPPSTYSSEHTTSSSDSLTQSFSAVTLTFGTDRPEVYLKMVEPRDMQTLCHCACNHQTDELRKFPHVSRLTTSISRSGNSSDYDSVHQSFSFASRNLVLEPRPSYHVIDLGEASDSDSSIEAFPTVSFNSPTNPREAFDFPLNDIQTDVLAVARGPFHDDAEPNTKCDLLITQLKGMIAAQFKLFEFIVALAVLMKTFVNKAIVHTQFRRIAN
ncbi:hypothetical protein BWQ96_03445 [Gracilariopsis chorda]|uniref:Transmembrane protein n=1 Tax=Gracilariopsis chorda TaxID=448386 RepID=A0A2V3IX68_9FLOR|nr:hypothetical protein BWQ96_03445 [Gracilariopsis chorda]|eukprot:PXF46754.1 hypothetical protein BWQ96_03445 [Gracilariopsis chorda]